MDLSAGRDIPEGGGKLPLLERTSKCPVLGRLAFHLLQTLKAPTSQSQFEINTLAHQDEGTEAGASHPSELPVPGPYLAHLAALGCFSPGVQAASGTFYCSAGKSQGWGLRPRSSTWGAGAGAVITVLEGAAGPRRRNSHRISRKGSNWPRFLSERWPLSFTRQYFSDCWLLADRACAEKVPLNSRRRWAGQVAEVPPLGAISHSWATCAFPHWPVHCFTPSDLLGFCFSLLLFSPLRFLSLPFLRSGPHLRLLVDVTESTGHLIRGQPKATPK